MLKDRLFGATQIPLLRLGLDTYALRHRAISDNVANAETYGYQRKEVKFEEKLEDILRMRDLRRTHEMHLSSVVKDPEELAPELLIDPTPSDINDMSNVDIDREMSDMAKNHLQFVFSGNMARRFFELLNTSIRGV